MWQVSNPDREAPLFCDQLGRQEKLETDGVGSQEDVFLFFLAPNSSHINQLWGEVRFKCFNTFAVGGWEHSAVYSVLTGSPQRDWLLASVYASERLAFTLANIRGAFRRCAL